MTHEGSCFSTPAVTTGCAIVGSTAPGTIITVAEKDVVRRNNHIVCSIRHLIGWCKIFSGASEGQAAKVPQGSGEDGASVVSSAGRWGTVASLAIQELVRAA